MSQLSDRTRAFIAASEEAGAKRRRRVFKWSAAAVLLLVAGGAAFWLLRPDKPPVPQEAQPLDIVKYVASDDFAKLPDEKKSEYLDKLERAMPAIMEAYRNNQISEEQRDKAMANAGPLMMRKRVGEYFKLQPGPQRVAYLDQEIDRMEERMRQMATRPSTRSATRPTTRDGKGPRWGNMMSAEAIKKRIESIPPDLQAQMAEYFAAMRKRREERGLRSSRPW